MRAEKAGAATAGKASSLVEATIGQTKQVVSQACGVMPGQARQGR